MKLKGFLVVALLGAAGGYAIATPAISTPAEQSASGDVAAYTHGQCQATAKSTGQRCKRGVSNAGDRFCFQHK